MEFTAKQLADFLQGAVDGNPDVKVSNFSKIEEGTEGTLTFLANPKYKHYIYTTRASIVLVNTDFVPSEPLKVTLVRVKNAYQGLAQLMELVGKSMARKTRIAPTAIIPESAQVGKDCFVGSYAVIGDNVTIGDNCMIYPHVCIGDNVTIGDNCVLYPHVTIYADCIIGKNGICHAGSVIGADGFGFARDPETNVYNKIPQLGNVIIEDDVEIGANTTIDRAVMGSTIVRKGVKLDNLIMIAHNVEVGENTVMASQVGVSGSVKIGKNCMFGGQAGMSGHIRIEDNVSIGPQAGIIGDVKEGSKVLGAPAIDSRAYMRSSAVFNRLPDMYRTLERLEKEIEKIKENNK